MGGGSWSSDEYAARSANRAATGASAFAYTDSVMKNVAPEDRKCHPTLDPKGVDKRESRDSAEHPNSKAVAVFFDETGSMGNTPRRLQEKLPKLMAMLLQKGALSDPQIMFGAIGDASGLYEKAPLQVSQFESDIKMDEHLGNIYLEGYGGGQTRESYELAMYFMANHISMDCLEKRGEKGYLFLMGDEMYYPEVKADEVLHYIGDKLEANVPTVDVVAKLQEQFEVFFIFTPSSSYRADGPHPGLWKQLLPERVIVLSNIDDVCETIAGAIAMLEGAIDHDSLDTHLQDVGVDAHTASNVKNALAILANRSVAKADVKGDLISSGSGSGLSTL